MKGNIFQNGLLIGFAVIAVVGFGFLALYQSEPEEGSYIGKIVIWGTLETKAMNEALKKLDELLGDYDGTIIYREKDPRFFNDEFVDALAAGTGPDLFVLNHGDIIKQLNKTLIIPYESYSERLFKDTYIEGAEIYLHRDGIIAFPIIVDPLIMYYNRNILSREGIATVPEYWDEFFTLSPKLTKVDSSANILLSTVPFGEYRNVANAKEIVSALILQTDNDITTFSPTNGRLTTVLRTEDESNSEGLSAVNAALRYYTEFSNPIKSVYSWNRALNDSKRAFLSEDLVFYFGFASELEGIRKSNPNLNFDIAPLPQIREDNTVATFGNMSAIAVTKSASNVAGSLRVASMMSNDAVLEILEQQTLLPPVSRSMLSQRQSDDVRPILYESALISHGWLEPDRDRVDEIFRDMIESISSGRQRIGEAVGEAGNELDSLIK